MTDMPSQEPQVTARRAAWRFRCFAVLATVLLVTGIGISVYWLRSSPASPPPLVDLTETDPAVAAVVKTARERVLAAPRSGQAWGHLGKVLLANEYYREAQVCLARAERLDPRNPRWPYFQAGINPANNPEAVAKLRRTIELCGDEPLTPQLRLAETLLAEGQVEEASKLFDRILSLSPGNPWAELGLAARIVRARRLARRPRTTRGAFRESVCGGPGCSQGLPCVEGRGIAVAWATRRRDGGRRGRRPPWRRFRLLPIHSRPRSRNWRLARTPR